METEFGRGRSKLSSLTHHWGDTLFGNEGLQNDLYVDRP